MKFTFADDQGETVIEINDDQCNVSHVDLELLSEEEKDEDKTEESEEANQKR